MIPEDTSCRLIKYLFPLNINHKTVEEIQKVRSNYYSPLERLGYQSQGSHFVDV